MAGEDDLLTLLGRALPALDDAALAALASPGLLRRARKDLEAGEAVEIPDPAGNPLELRVAGCAVRIPAAGPAAATCDCRAPGTCRHILMALLHLQGWLAARPATAAPEPPPPACTLEEVARWAGKKTLAEARRLLAAAPGVEVEEGEPGAVTVRFPEFGVECRHLPGAGLDGMIANAPAKVRRRFLAAAMLAWLRTRGLILEDGPAPPAPREPAGAPRTRAQVIAEARGLFAEMLSVGLSHLSPAPGQRLATLAVSALGANLPRLSLLLRGLAGEAGLLTRRAPQADEARLLLGLARAAALCEALGDGRGAPPGLIGEHRGRYEPVGHLELQGAGAWAWRTRSGFGGLTALFWSPAGRRWLTWSESRPRHVTGDFSPAARYAGEGPWSGVASPREACRSRLTLTGARRNGEGRLSASEGCRALPLEPSRLAGTDFGDRLFTGFGELRRHAAAIYPAGLAERRPDEEIVVVRPAAWGRRGFDPILQTFRWELLDAAGEPLRLEVPWDDTGRPVVETLESLRPEPDGVWGLIGRISRDAAGLLLSPAVLLRHGEPEIVSLGLDPFRGSAERPGSRGRIEIAAPPADPWLTRIETGLARLEEELLRLAESGRHAVSGALGAELAARGLPRLAEAVAGLGEAGAELPARLLRARWLCELHRQAAVRSAIGGEEQGKNTDQHGPTGT